MTRICIIGISGKLGQYMTQHALDRGFDVVGVCRPESVSKLARFEGRITVYPGRTDDAAVVARAVKGCDAVLTVLAPWGYQDYSSGTARAVLENAEPGARLIFSPAAGTSAATARIATACASGSSTGCSPSSAGRRG